MRRAACILLFLAIPALAQLPVINFSGGGGSSPDGTFQGNATFRVPVPPVAMVPNTPFSGEQRDSVETNGQVQIIGMHQKVARDSAGRVRIEQPYIAAANAPKYTPTLMEIYDPVAGYAYILDDIAHVTHRIKLNVPAETRGPQEGGQEIGTESIDGVPVTHTRSSDDAAIPTIRDEWISKDFELLVRMVINDPRTGVVTHEIAHLKTGEPDPALFQPPAGYTVVDETMTFTIKWGE